MNHLAHLLVSNDNSDWIGGALAADELRGQPPASYSADAVRAVLLHRSLDAYTDSHPVTRETRAMFPQYRHYARVLVDVFYDHVLALDFQRYSPEPLPLFSQRMYKGLDEARQWLPPALARRLPRMIEDDFLQRYRTPEHIVRTLSYLSSRFSRPIDLTPAMDLYRANTNEIHAQAHAFLPQMIHQASRRKTGSG